MSYSSRALTPTEQRYSQLERECLSLVYGCEKNRIYLLGRQFTLYNDHKALIQIINNPRSNVPLCIERLTLRLHGFDFVFKHVKGENNISDYPSRHPVDTTRSYNETEQYVNFVAAAATPNAFSLDDVKMETKRDTLLQELAILIRSDQWYKLDKTPNNVSDVNA